MRWPGATARVLLALAAGAILGLALAHWQPDAATAAAGIAQPIGRLWLSALQMTVVPLVLALVILGVATASDAAASGRVARRAMVVFIAMLAFFAGYAALVAQSEVQTNTVLRILKKGGVNPTYIPCTVAINTVPVQQEGQIDRLRVQFSGRARPTRYTGAL